MCREWTACVVRVDDDGTAVVDVDGGLHRVSLVVLQMENVPVHAGDRITVHTGLATSVLPPATDSEQLKGNADEH